MTNEKIKKLLEQYRQGRSKQQWKGKPSFGGVKQGFTLAAKRSGKRGDR